MEPRKQILRIKRDGSTPKEDYGIMLSNLAIAEASMLSKNSKALGHFIAIVKELEALYGFHFEYVDDPNG